MHRCKKVKLNGKLHEFDFTWIGSTLLAYVSGENIVRVLDIEKDEKNIFDLASSGFASTVRLAKSSPDMWTPIFEQNSEYLGQALMEYIMHLQKFHYLLMKKDTKELHKIMSRANEIRRVLDGIELKNLKPELINNK